MYQYNEELDEFIPPSFELAKYRTLSHASLEDWMHQFSARFSVANGLALGVDHQDHLIRARYTLENNILWGDIRKDPAWAGEENVHQSINPLQVDNIIAEYSDLNPKLQSYAAKVTLLNVNIHESDAVLVQHFKEWLESEREKKEVEPLSDYSNARIKRWHQFRVLAYIDIKQWHIINDIRCTNGQMALILYPDDTSGNGVERIRKTTRPMAIRVIDQQIHNFLLKYYFYGKKINY